ncbi:ABC transporter substrate-binding protein [Candidatus Microgenomates bacterium]|nr:ABC transporter substrate-binding protein [Candidatus Microgenomates bacterium]
MGITGSYTIESLPLVIQEKISLGLTKVNGDGMASPAVASSWTVSEDGKVYTVKLRTDLSFQDNKRLKSQDINYNFKDAKFEIIDDNTVRFTLNESFSPFLTVLSQPIFKKGLIGVGEYKVKKASFNGSFVTTLVLVGTKNDKNKQIIYRFYPTDEALKTAFTLGEIDRIEKLYDVSQFYNWPNAQIDKTNNTAELVVIFFNTRDANLSSKNTRQALIYALPDKFEEGETASSPLRPTSFAYIGQPDKFTQNLKKSRELLGETSATSSMMTIKLSADRKLEKVASQIAKVWQDIGVKTDIELTRTAPAASSNWQAFLGILRIPPDPDQYILWHSTQINNNIMGYANQKIDKLLEDGRKTQDQTEREKIYADFQKYLVDDAPAAFLYYPTVYTVKRK